jgi:hypothetical protein
LFSLHIPLIICTCLVSSCIWFNMSDVDYCYASFSSSVTLPEAFVQSGVTRSIQQTFWGYCTEPYTIMALYTGTWLMLVISYYVDGSWSWDIADGLRTGRSRSQSLQGNWKFLYTSQRPNRPMAYGVSYAMGASEKLVKKTEITAIGIRHADHATPLYPPKLTQTSPTSGGDSVGIVRSQTQATEFSLVAIVEVPLTYISWFSSRYECISFYSSKEWIAFSRVPYEIRTHWVA